MSDYKLTNKAVEDLTEIWDYTIENWSEEQAEKYYLALISSFDDIAKNPRLGRRYTEISNEIYGFICERHIVFYLEDSDGCIEIVRILHVRMDLHSKGI